jgi:ribonuclease P protein component
MGGNWGRNVPDLQAFLRLHTPLHTCGGSVTVRHIWRHFTAPGLWTTLCTDAPLYWPLHAPVWSNFLSLRTRETDLPAQRAAAEAQARLPCPHGDARRSRDPQAPPRPGPEAPFRVTAQRPVQRRHRLSRSRDFDAVYRQGRSTSTRFLVLYWFDRDDDPGEPRLGLAVPKAAGNAVARNRIKRQLREVWRERLERVPAGRDYVLIAKPGLPEAVEANGFGWLSERVDEVLQKAAA